MLFLRRIWVDPFDNELSNALEMSLQLLDIKMLIVWRVTCSGQL